MELCFLSRSAKKEKANEKAFMGGSHTWCLCFTAVLNLLQQRWRATVSCLDDGRQRDMERKTGKMGHLGNQHGWELLLFSFLRELYSFIN